MSHISSAPGSRGIPTFALLDQMVTVLGGTKLSFWPFIQATGTTLSPYGSGTDGVLLTASSAIESILDPLIHVGGVYSLKNDGTTAWLQSADDADYSFATGGFSVGAWVLMEEPLGTVRSVVSKYRSDAATLREYDFRFTTGGLPVLEIFDESVPADWTSTCVTNTITPFIWQFVVATYSGTEGASAIVHYLNATAETPTGVETGLFVAMEDTAAPVGIGHRNPATAAQVFVGRIALPFITGVALTAANVTTLYGLGRKLLGLAN